MVRTDPEPDDLVLLKNSKRSAVDAYSYRVHWTSSANPLEFQSWMIGVRNKKAVGVLCLLADLGSEAPISIPKATARKRLHVYNSSGSKGSVSPARWSDRASLPVDPEIPRIPSGQEVRSNVAQIVVPPAESGQISPVRPSEVQTLSRMLFEVDYSFPRSLYGRIHQQ